MLLSGSLQAENGTCRSEQLVDIIMFSFFTTSEIDSSSLRVFSMLFIQIFLPSTTPAISFFSPVISSDSRFFIPLTKSSPIPQTGVFARTVVASHECSKYVVTAILMFSAVLPSLM